MIEKEKKKNYKIYINLFNELNYAIFDTKIYILHHYILYVTQFHNHPTNLLISPTISRNEIEQTSNKPTKSEKSDGDERKSPVNASRALTS